MIAKDLVAASSRPLVLSILAAGENYGYAILQQVREASNGDIVWSEGMLYPVLHRLEKEGLIEASWKEAESGRERKYYRLCRPGRIALQDLKLQWSQVHNTLCRLWK